MLHSRELIADRAFNLGLCFPIPHPTEGPVRDLVTCRLVCAPVFGRVHAIS